MPAQFIPIGEPAHDAERAAIAMLVANLPRGYTVYGNPWLVERSGVIYELDAVVVAPTAIFIVEMKAWRGHITGNDHDWYVPHPVRSPLKNNRLTAQILKSQLRNESWQAGQVWVEGLIFLSATLESSVDGPASRDRVHTRRTILSALQDPAFIERLSGRRALAPTTQAEKELLRLLTGVRSGPRPTRRFREYEVLEALDHRDTYSDILARNTLSDDKRVLRIYSIPPLAPEETRTRIESRARWEAQVLGRLGRIEGIVAADPPFSDEVGIVLPMEYFGNGITLPTWLSRYGPDAQPGSRPAQANPTGARPGGRADLRARTDLWIRLARTLDEAHRQGVVHRLLRPEVVLVEDSPQPSQVRVTGFDLAKQVSIESTLSLTTLADERLLFAAPEVISMFSSAEAASDQFSLGALLALILTGKPLFDSTRQLMAARRLMRRVRDMAQRVPLSLDEAVARMVALRPTDRFPSLAEAIRAVEVGRDPDVRVAPQVQTREAPALDPDHLEPGTRIGTDYEILSLLGQGGMAVVYAARHLVSGRTRALKIARPETPAEDALRGEHKVLERLDHPNIVRVLDISKMVEGRLTLVMERVSGESLRAWLAARTNPEPAAMRSLAEDLLAGLEYLENQGITHKDLKPDNLIVSDGRLVVIDFSLADMPADAIYGGTALYRDPAILQWNHDTDRFAAALCLFELYAGRHAFDGRVPEPGQAPEINPDDVDPAGLCAFFRKALDPVPQKRFPSARAMRDAFVVALGDELPTVVPQPGEAVVPQPPLDANTPLSRTSLSRRAVKALACNQVQTVGDLVALPDANIRAMHSMGTKAVRDVLAFKKSLDGLGIAGARSASSGVPVTGPEPPLVPELVDSPEPIHQLALVPSVHEAFQQARLPTVGSVASLSHGQLLALPGMGRGRLGQVVEALRRFLARSPASTEGAHTLDGIWDQASRPLSDSQRTAVERVVGLLGPPELQASIAADVGRTQPQISHDYTAGLQRLDMASLSDALAGLDQLVDGFGGIARLDEMGRRFEETWPPDLVSGEGMVRLLVAVGSGRASLIEVERAQAPLVARPSLDRETLRAFSEEVFRLASTWPPVEPETARRTLGGLLYGFHGDALALGVRLCDDVQVAETGHLFVAPLEPRQSIRFVLDQARDPLSLEELAARVRRIFGPETPFPAPEHLPEILADLECQVQGESVVPGHRNSILALPSLPADELPVSLGASRTPEEVVLDMLRDASGSRGFRMVVTPPELHSELGPQVAAALKGRWLSFDEAFFTDHADSMRRLERAERFVAQRGALTAAAEDTLFRLLEEHGAPGRTLVLGDTCLLGLCRALDLPRRLYDETLGGQRGFWVLVVPGVIHNRQPRFNEGPEMWHLQGATVPLTRPLPQAGTSEAALR